MNTESSDALYVFEFLVNYSEDEMLNIRIGATPQWFSGGSLNFSANDEKNSV